jgi:multiphosphoryl transfer protein
VSAAAVAAGLAAERPAEYAPAEAGTAVAAPVGASAATGARPARAGGRALGASPGIAIGPARLLRSAAPVVPDSRADDAEAEWAALSAARAVVAEAVTRTRELTARTAGAEESAIFDAHLMMLDDPELLDDVRSRLDRGQAAAPAWAGAVDAVVRRLAALPGEYLRARAADVRAVGDQVLRALLGEPVDPDPAAADGVLVAADLTPADAAALDPASVVGVVLATGSPTAHAAILLRAKGIPAIVGAGPAVLGIAPATMLALDGATGELLVDPSDEMRARFRDRAAARVARERIARSRAGQAARTRDGTRILVGVNAGSAADAAAAPGADVAGLVRTEFLFVGRRRAPGVDEQEAAYRAVAEALGGRRITLRTLDVGGDKPLDYVPMPVEANPFLGVRGLRLALRRPELLTDQLRAVVRTAHATPVSLMFPMVSTVDELLSARALLADAIAAEGRGEPAGLQVGIMVEVPATALKAAAFAPHVDFLSIGTNDLTQYALAAERGNEAVAAVADPLDPGVLALIDAVCRGAGPDLLVAVCGELAADERAVPLLVGLGVRGLSVAAPALAGVKEAVRAVDLAEATALAARAVRAGSAAEVRDLLD